MYTPPDHRGEIFQKKDALVKKLILTAVLALCIVSSVAFAENILDRLDKPLVPITPEAASASPANDAGPVIKHPAMGFQMALPNFAEVEKQRGIVFSWNFPPQDGFADNINVMVQDNELPFGQLLKQSVAELEQAGLTVVKVSPIGKKGYYFATVEYKGNFQGRDMHWLAKMAAGDQKFYIITCTAMEKTFASRRPEFEKVLAGFQVLKK